MAGVPVAGRFGVAWDVVEAGLDHSEATPSFNAFTRWWHAVSAVMLVWLYGVLVPL